MKHITVKGFWGSRVSSEMDPDERKRLITELVTLTATGKLALEDGGVFSIDQISAALKAALTPGRAGKVMISG